MISIGKHPCDEAVSKSGNIATPCATEIPANLDPPIQAALKQTIAGAFIHGFRLVMVLSSALPFMSALAAWLMIEGKPAPRRPA